MSSTTLPVIDPTRPQRPRSRDLARGARFWVFWAGPIAVLVLGPAVARALHGSFAEMGVPLVLGSAWLGAICLANALRCGRVHCAVDGALLPVLALVGTLDLFGRIAIPWTSYGEGLVAIVVGGFVLECLWGPYALRRAI